MHDTGESEVVLAVQYPSVSKKGGKRWRGREQAHRSGRYKETARKTA